MLTTVAFSPDGKILLFGGGDGAVRIWNLADGTQPRRFGVEHTHNRRQAFSRDGGMVVSVNGAGEIELWDVGKWRQLYTLKVPLKVCHGLALGSDRQHLALTDGPHVLLGKLVITKQTPTLKGTQKALTAIAVHPGGGLLASGGADGSIVMWDILGQPAFRPIHTGSGEILRLSFSADGQHLAWLASDGTVMLRSIEDDRTAAILRPKTGTSIGMAVSPGGHRMATVTTDSELILWDLKTAPPVPSGFSGMTGAIADLAFGPDGRLLAGAGGQEIVWLWDASRGRVMTELPVHFWITSLAFSPDGQYVAAGGGKRGQPGEIRVWKLPGGQPVCTCQGHTDVVQCLTFSPQSNRLISGSSDQTVKVWEVIGGQETMALREHSGPIRGLAFSPDGQRLFSASSDGSIKIWEAPDGRSDNRPPP
jgi:WD40 repeat protein